MPPSSRRTWPPLPHAECRAAEAGVDPLGLCADNLTDATTAAIVKGARAVSIGDGKIFVLDMPECIRIRTGERGEDAVG